MAMDFINSFTKSGKPVEDLSRFAYLMNELGNPQAHLKCIHIAGTNGKGSVTRYCAEACRLSGYKTGEFIQHALKGINLDFRKNEDITSSKRSNG